MLDFVRKGTKPPGPKVLRRIESAEAAAGWKTFTSPSTTTQGRLQFLRFVSQEDWPYLAERFGITPAGMEALRLGKRSATPGELQRLTELEEAHHIQVPATAPRSESAASAPPPSSPTPGPAIERRLQTVETLLREILQRLDRLENR